MEDFFDKFKDNLENRPPPEFEERDWNDLEQKLERADKPNKQFAMMWFLLPLLLLLLGSNGYWVYKLSLQTTKPTQLIIKTDTIWKNSVVYQTDTIYRTQVIYTQPIHQSARKTSSNTIQNNRLTFHSTKWSTFGEKLFTSELFSSRPHKHYTSYSAMPKLLNGTNSTPGLSSSTQLQNFQVIDKADQFGVSPLLPIIDLSLLNDNIRPTT